MATSGQYSRSVLGASDEIKDIYCEPCSKDGNVAIAEGYCNDCHEYLCTQCYKSHRRNKVLANHVLLDKNSMPIAPDSGRRVLDICDKKCTIHSEKVIEFFCETCDKLGCHVCVTLDHRQCEKVKHIPDVANKLERNEEFITFYEGIKSTADELLKLEHKIQANVTYNKDMQKLAKRELKRQRAQVNKFFDELEKKMDDQITIIEKRNKASLMSASDKLKPIKTDLDQIKNDIEAKKSRQNSELFISMKKNKEKMKTFNDQVNKVRKELGIQSYTLLPSEQIQALMRTTTEICRISTARLESVIDIKTSKDKTNPNINSLTIMHGHYCVVADGDNKTIKVVDTKSKQVISEIGIEADFVWSMTSVSDDQVVVSVTLFDYRKQIQFFSVSTSGVIQRTNQLYYVDDCYMDMVHCKDNIYGVNDDKIDILNMTGKTIKTIQTDHKGAELFSNLERIALSPGGQTIYVTDSYKNSVTSLTLDGKVKAIYTDKDLKSYVIAVDKYGYVYVGSHGTYNIHQLTAGLNKVQVLIEDDVGTNVTYSGTENKLYTDNNQKINEYSLDFK